MFEQEFPSFLIPEKNHLKWSGKKEEIIICHFEENNPSEYILWMQAGQKTPPLPQYLDPNYNSNIWHNFKNPLGLKLSANNCTISESIAIMYPLTLPTYSQMGKLSWEKFLEESSYLKNCSWKSCILKRPPSNHKQLAQLKLLSELRDPPQNEKGNILPHKNYKIYPSKIIQPVPTRSSPLPIFGVPRDLFGRKIEQKKKKQCTKLTSKRTNIPQNPTLT